MITELLLLCFFIFILHRFVLKSKTQKLFDQIPGPKHYPLVGNIFDFNYPKEEITQTTEKLSFKYGPVCLIYLGMEALVMLRDPDDIEGVLGNISLIEKGPVYWPLLPWLQQGLLTSGGQKWKKNRKILTPAFHFKVLEKFIPIFAKHTQVFLAKLESHVGEEFDITPLLALCTLDSICETAMGLEVHAQEKESEYVKAVNKILDIVAHRSFSLIQRSFLFPFLPIGRQHDRLISYLHDVTDSVIRERENKLTDEDAITSSVGINEDDGETKTKKVFLDLLLEYNKNGAGMTDTEMRDEINTFMFEGFDTTTSSFSFCLYCLSQNQTCQDKVVDELHQIFGNSNRDPTHHDLQQMKYSEKVIKESLRLYPTIQFVSRQSSKELTLKSGYTIPANTSIVILIEPLHHDPKFYPEPYKFDPERFNQRSIHPYAYIPFGAGPRNCIGQKYAMLELKCMLCLILRKYRLLPSDVPITPSFNIVFKSSTGVHMKFVHRET